MTYYIRYAVVDDTPITLTEIEQGLRKVSPGYEIDADFLVFNEEEYGLIEIVQPDYDLFASEIELMMGFAEQKENKKLLLAILERTQCLIVVQAIWSKGDRETLSVIEKVFEWLMQNRTGLVMDEGGIFYEDFTKLIT